MIKNRHLGNEPQAMSGRESFSKQEDRKSLQPAGCKVGVALACHNPGSQLEICLSHVFASQVEAELFVVVVDDGSTDGSIKTARERFRQIRIVEGDGTLWWAGATNLAITECLNAGCEAVILLNPDVTIEANAIAELWSASKRLGDAIVSPLVIQGSDRTRIWEAGHSWARVIEWLPLFWRSGYLFPRGTPLASIPASPYPTVSVVGRGGLIPRMAFEKLGLLDAAHFPQYGADGVLSVKALRHGWPMYVVPQARVLLDINQSGMGITVSGPGKIKGFSQFMFSRKHGERARVLWRQSVACVPWYAVPTNYILWLGLNSLRYWQAARSHPKHSSMDVDKDLI